MEIAKIIDQFITFYGTSVAPHDLLLLSAQVPEVLEIINVLVQFHSQQMIAGLNLPEIMNDATKNPDGIAETFAKGIFPLSERYRQALQKITELAHLPPVLFESLQINVILRLACCFCLTLIKSSNGDSSLVEQLNEFSGSLGLFQSKKYGPLQFPKGEEVEVPSPVRYTAKGGGRKTRRHRMRNKKIKTRKQRGGVRLWQLLLALLAPHAPAVAPNAVAPPTPLAIADVTAASFTQLIGEMASAVVPAFEVPPLPGLEALPPLENAPFFDVATSGGRHKVFRQFNIKPHPGLKRDIIKLDNLGRAAMTLNTLYYLGQPPEIGAAVVFRSSDSLAPSWGGSFLDLGFADDSIKEGKRGSVVHSLNGRAALRSSFPYQLNLYGHLHCHPPIAHRVGSQSSYADVRTHYKFGLQGRSTVSFITTQTGLVMTALNPDIMAAWSALVATRTLAEMQGFHSIFMRSFDDLHLTNADIKSYMDDTGSIVKVQSMAMKAGRYKLVRDRAAETPDFTFQVGPTRMTVDSLLHVVFIPFEQFFLGEVNIPVYAWPVSYPGALGIPVAPAAFSSAGVSLRELVGEEVVRFQYRTANNTVLPQIPFVGDHSITCANPRSILLGLQDYRLQQRCLWEIYQRKLHVLGNVPDAKNIPYSALAPILSTEFAEFPTELLEVFRIIRQLFAES
jgi:hypothetical protein